MLGGRTWYALRLYPFVDLAVMEADAFAQQQLSAQAAAARTVAAQRLAPGERISLDGRLDEEVWQRAVPAGDFVQIDPDNGAPPTEPTEVRIAFDSESFYMGVTAFDSEPDKWLGHQRRRDEFLGSDDRFMWTIDTFLGARSGYFFEMNPAWNAVRLPEGRFPTNVYRFLGETQFSPYVSVTNNIQYDTQSDVLGWQSRFRWILEPGSDLYIVYTHNWLEDAVLNRFATLDKRIASKALYTYRF